ncbi:uncharacterized protein LOC117103182 [Anneissia japonica]|uniref:uncharacterized protein LOC117103182 n=1 Tax=Anneissia japonica TaxID=1529436 RepID=UPI0014258263|nr:uncharacterized protein LOC117103182 [Anneissia japonica]
MSPSIYITCQPSPENILRKTHWKGMDGPLLSETQGPITTEAEEASAIGSSSLKLGATLTKKTTRKQSKNSTWIENVSFEDSDRSQFRIQDGGAGAFDERASEESFLLPTTSADDSMVAAERTSIILCEATGQSTIDIADMLNSQDSGILSAGDDSTFTLTGEQSHAKLIINKSVEMKSNPEVHSGMSASCDGSVEEANAANFKLPNVNKTLNANNAIRANSFDLEMTNLGLSQDVNGETGLAPILTDAEMVQIDHDGKEYEVDAKSCSTDVGTANIGQVLIDTNQLAVAVESLNGATIDTSGVATLNPNVLQLNISNISPVSLSTLGNGQNQPLIYLLTSQEKTTGSVQRFRVSMDQNTSSSTVSDLQLEMADAVDSNNTTLEANKLLTHITEGKDERHNHETIEASALLDGEAQTAPMLSVLDVIQLSDGNQAFVLDGNTTTTTTSTPVETIKQKKEPKKKKKKVKEDEQEQKCEECGEMVANKAKLKVHLLSHKTDRPYKCEVEGCGWSFQTLYKLKRHKMGHGGNKPFVCRVENCGKPFTTIYNLKIHMNTHFRQNLEVCDVEGCEEVFNSKAKLQIHQRKHFLDQQLQCTHPGCDKTFTTTSALGSHQRIHERDQHSFPCLVEGCGKVYEKSCRLKLHMMSHTGERPFKCTFEGCQWAFTCIQKLKRHLVRHTGERKYMCNQDGCNKMFTRLEHLKGHLVSHSGEKPYKCTVEGCNASFSARSSHYMHVKRHKMGKPIKEKYTFCCPWDNCEKMFSSRMGVKNHVIKTHGTPLSFDNEMVFVKLNKDDGKEEEQVESSLASTQVQQMTSPQSVDLSQVASLPQGTVDITELITNAGEIDKQLLLPSLPVSVLTQAADASMITNYTSTLGNNLCVTVPQVVDTLTEDVSASRVRSKIIQENQSGSARTDFIALPKEIRIREMDSRSDLVTSETVKVSSNSTLSFSSSIFPLSSVSTTGLTLRDPSTGTPYVQTQLLQDDPPGEGDVAFHLSTTTVSPHASLVNQLSVSILPTSINQSQDAAKTFLNTGSRVTDFTQSTINLQDLE